MCFAVAADVAFGQIESDTEAVEMGREALVRETFPWYDEETDSLRRIDVQPPEETATNRGSTWKATPPAPPKFSNFWTVLWTILKWLFWGLLIVGLIVLIYLLIRAFLNIEGGAATSVREIEMADPRSEADLIESLPFQLQSPSADFLAEARRLYELGKFEEAIVYLYSYLLVQLDQHHVIRLARGKTNRQYLREVRRRNDLRPMFEHTMLAFEDAFFGHYRLSRERFESCWQRLSEFHQRLDLTASSVS